MCPQREGARDLCHGEWGMPLHQCDLAAMLGAPRPSIGAILPDGGVEVFDFFCGAGGFSQGAVQAGHRVVFACDSDADALETHARNHPQGCEHRCVALPVRDIPYPTDGRAFHLHGSPPCQTFSAVNRRNGAVSETELVQSERLVRWFLKQAVSKSGCTTWSMEEVDSPRIRAILEKYRSKHADKVAWAVFDFEMLGVPQSRKRLIAGSPALIVRLQQLRGLERRRGASSVLTDLRGTHIIGTRGTGQRRQKHKREPGTAKFFYKTAEIDFQARPVSKPAPTVCAGVPPSWITARKGERAHSRARMDTDECAALQTFPPGYKWPEASGKSLRQIGNAVPPLVAQLLMGGK